MKEYFVDTSFFFIWHDDSACDADEVSELIHQEKPNLITTDIVFIETMSLITKRMGKKQAMDTGKAILSSRSLQIIEVGKVFREQAWNLFTKYKDKTFDLVDSCSFIVCKQRGIRDVFTLDRHFTQMGFIVWPSQKK